MKVQMTLTELLSEYTKTFWVAWNAGDCDSTDEARMALDKLHDEISQRFVDQASDQWWLEKRG